MNQKIINRVNQALINIGQEINKDLCIVETKTKEINDYYFMIYNSKDYIQTGNISSALVGNFPILVCKNSSEVYLTNRVDIYFDSFFLKDLKMNGYISKIT